MCLLVLDVSSSFLIHISNIKSSRNKILSIFGFQGTICMTFHHTVGLSGLEPPTSRLSGVRSNRLSYKPSKIWQPPALPYRLQHSTIGRLCLNRRVRDGNGCVPWAHRHRKISNCFTPPCTTILTLGILRTPRTRLFALSCLLLSCVRLCKHISRVHRIHCMAP